MTFEQIKELHGMGFSNDQIMTLSRDQPEQENTEHEKEDLKSEQENQEPEQEKPEQNQLIIDLQNQVKELTKLVQKQNVKTASINTLPNDLDSQVDKIMSELIRPEIKEENKK